VQTCRPQAASSSGFCARFYGISSKPTVWAVHQHPAAGRNGRNHWSLPQGRVLKHGQREDGWDVVLSRDGMNGPTLLVDPIAQGCPDHRKQLLLSLELPQ
jgi:hypothetical protein